MAEGSATAPVLLIERAGAVATITLNRPDRGNALTSALKSELLAALTRVGDDEGEVAAVRDEVAALCSKFAPYPT